MVSTPHRLCSRSARTLLFLALLSIASPALAAPPTTGKGQKAKTGNGEIVQTALPAQLNYGFEVGKTYHYKVIAFLSGQIPKLSAPGADAHFKIELYYAASVLKQDTKGTSVSFSVEKELVSLLAKEPGPDGKIKPDDELPFPLPKAQVQSYLNVTALLRPDGSIADLTGGSNDPIKIDLGVDLRKLFILMLPVVFPQTVVDKGAKWPFEEGFLGHKPGSTTYIGHLAAVHPNPKHVVFQVTQDAQSVVNDKVDSEGNSTTDPKLQVGLISGTVTAVSSMNFETGPPIKKLPPGQAATYAGRLSTGTLTLNVNLKRELPDPDHPDQKQISPILVRGRMAVTIQNGPPKDDSETPASVSQTTGGKAK